MTATCMAFLTGGLASLSAGSAAATTALLDYDPMQACEGPCRRRFVINSSYGTTADVAVTHQQRIGFGNTAIADSKVRCGGIRVLTCH